MKKYIALALSLTLMTACVSTKKYKALDKQRSDCEDKNNTLTAQAAILQLDTAKLNSEYLALAGEKSNLEKSSLNEKQNLNQELGKTQQQLNDQAKQLAEKETLLEERENKLKVLQDKLDQQAALENQLKSTVANALLGFKGEDLSVEMRDGKVYVSLSENLLFKSGSATIDPKGKDAINKLAAVLEKNPNIDIMVEGHTDNVPLIPGKYQDNWDLSTARALTIVRILTEDNKVDPTHVTAAGHGQYMPIASNDTPQGKAQNRRTEIILSPKLDALYQMLEQK